MPLTSDTAERAALPAGTTGASHPDDASPRRRFRPDVQALRAIAVALVVLYHLHPRWAPGGFIGVDVFFVISGFLITSHLVREARTTGHIRLGAFWAARARRILPAALVTIAITIGVTTVYSSLADRALLRPQALASIFYVQNWRLAHDSVDYLASDNQATPFQHFWSLAVEEQFYLLWPLLVVLALVLAAWLVRRRGAVRAPSGETTVRSLTWWLTVLFGVVVAVSLLWSVVEVAGGHADAYFVTTTRMWELGAGGLLSLAPLARVPRWARALLAYGGLLAIALSAALLTSDTPFPGLAAIPTILGTAAVIAAGTHRDADRVLGRWDPWSRAATLPSVQWLGDRSYSLYLWHFPVVVLFMAHVKAHPGRYQLLALVTIALLLAAASYRFVEQPVRTAPFLKRSTGRTLVLAAVAMGLTASLTLSYSFVNLGASRGWDGLASSIDTTSPGARFGAAYAGDGTVTTFIDGRPAMTPNPLRAAKDRDSVVPSSCHGSQRSTTTPVCTFGPSDASTTVALVGDSHARMYGTPFVDLANEHDWRLSTYLHSSCPLSPVPRNREQNGAISCTEPNKDVMKDLLADPPDVVVTTWYATAFEDSDKGTAAAAAGFAEYWNELEDAGSQVVVLRDVPTMKPTLQSCLTEHYATPDTCGLPPKAALHGTQTIAAAMKLSPRTHLVDLTDRFCTATLCKPVIGSVAVYREFNHITETYARSLEPDLAAAVTDALAGA